MSQDSGTTVGEMLRAGREAKGLTLEAVNQATKISYGVLNALEQDDVESFESDIYLKGFLRTYANYLGLDVDALFRNLDRQRGAAPSPRGALWDIEETVAEEKLKSLRIFRRVIVPLLFLLIVVLTILYFAERRKVKSLTPGKAHSYLLIEQNTFSAT